MNTYGTSMAKPLDEVRQHTIVPVPNTVTMYRSLVACSVINFSLVQSNLVNTRFLSFGNGNTSSIGTPRVEEVHAQVELNTRKGGGAQHADAQVLRVRRKIYVGHRGRGNRLARWEMTSLQ